MSGQAVIDFEAAARRRAAGMASSAGHADDDAPGWGERALAYLQRYSLVASSPWNVEQFRAWAYGAGLDRPDEERAFGAVTQKALRTGVIERAGYAPAASSNGSIKPLYQRPASDLPPAA